MGDYELVVKVVQACTGLCEKDAKEALAKVGVNAPGAESAARPTPPEPNR